MVNIAGTVPKGDANGLDAHIQQLAKGHGTKKYFAVGVVETTKITIGKDYDQVPTIGFTRIELIADGDTDLESRAADLLQAAGDRRRSGAGQQAFNLKGDAEPEAPETLELDAGAGYYFRVVDSAPGRFDVLLCTQHVAGVNQRCGLLREEWSEIPPGDYQRHELDEAFQSLADVLVEEWETNHGAAQVDDVVDAEVIDEDESSEQEESDR